MKIFNSLIDFIFKNDSIKININENRKNKNQILIINKYSKNKLLNANTIFDNVSIGF